MKISVRLPLAFAAALSLLFAGALFGIYRLNVAVATYQGDVLSHVAANKTGAEVSSVFATAIQEWKNVLLRGKQQGDLDKYWAAHQQGNGQGRGPGRHSGAARWPTTPQAGSWWATCARS
jgi:hypothetical protein